MTIFESDRRHFFRYETAEDAPQNPSTRDHMFARCKDSVTRQPVKKGDVVWVLRNLETQKNARGRYRFVYAFLVDVEPRRFDGHYRLEGQTGLWLPDSQVVNGLEWFDKFFQRMGRGGTSFIQLQADEVEHLRELFGPKTTVSADASVEMAEEAQQRGWPEDSVRYGAIKARRGQADFRARLMTAYGRRCCVSGCRVEALLEAAHIRPHAEAPNYDTRNGLLLRADLHTLYDLHLLGVDEYGNVLLAPEVTDPYYKELVSKVRRITPPDRGEDRPSEDDRRVRMTLLRR